MELCAHRGLSGQAPENSLSAFILAAEAGLPWVELDVQLSADGVPVVIHDESVDRCSDGHGRVRELSLAQLQSLDGGSWFDPAYAGEAIPTLADVLALCLRYPLKVNVELKAYASEDLPALCEAVAQVIEGLALPADCLLFSSFDTQALTLMQQRLPQVPRGQLWQKIPADPLPTLANLQAWSAHCDYRHLDAQLAQQIKQAGYRLHCYTPNDPAWLNQATAWGVDMLISDHPERFTH
ncbi:glycerophosphodiester phosphodiesterase family protein [Pseudaeromonas paramecii]|uniref:Glycerophosphoryl diester phosphodiesterase n=1 Tax=Pseudaeromonas paramecii TaxID=2138166 RepID=A0ABP8QHX7_9GAMM